MEKVLGALSKKVAYRSHLVFRLLLCPLHLVDPLAEVKVGILHLGADSTVQFEFLQQDIILPKLNPSIGKVGSICF